MSGVVTVTVERTFGVSPETLFDAWTNPAEARRFLFATPDGEIIQCDIDARVGGRFLIVDRRKDGDAHHHGEFTVIDRPSRLAFKFRGPGTKEGEWSFVSLAFDAVATGTRLTLTHDIPAKWASYAGPVREGWAMILTTLGDRMEKKND